MSCQAIKNRSLVHYKEGLAVLAIFHKWSDTSLYCGIKHHLIDPIRMFSDEVPALSSDLLPSQMLEVVSFKYIIPHGFEYTSFKYIYYCECKFFYTDRNVLTDVGKLNIFKQLFAAIARASHRSQPKVTDMRFILLGENCKEKG